MRTVKDTGLNRLRLLKGSESLQLMQVVISELKIISIYVQNAKKLIFISFFIVLTVYLPFYTLAFNRKM